MTENDETRPAPFSRRRLLRTAGVTAVAAGVAATTTGMGVRRAGENLPPGATAPDDYDAIVVGAGFAGVTAARELGRAGLRVLVLEARDRIGGRTWSDNFAGQTIELGGAWVDPLQPLVWHEVSSRSAELYGGISETVSILPAAGGGLAEYDPEEASARFASLGDQIFAGAQDYFPLPHQPFTREDLLARVDGLSLRNRIDQLGLGEVDHRWATGLYGGQAGGSPRGAFTQMLQWWALCDSSYGNFVGINSAALVRGTGSLLDEMLAERPPVVELSSPVVRVHDDGRRVTVVTRSGEQRRARAVVMAVPVNVWKTITFTPTLPKVYLDTSVATIGTPTTKKLWLRVRSDKGRFYARGGEGEHPVNSIIPYAELPDGDQVMFAFSTTLSFDPSDRAQVAAALDALVPGAELVDFRGQDWARDPYSLGGWPFKQPGQLTGVLRQVQRPQGRIAFATSDIADGWSGWIDGAIERGLAAAQLVASW